MVAGLVEGQPVMARTELAGCNSSLRARSSSATVLATLESHCCDGEEMSAGVPHQGISLNEPRTPQGHILGSTETLITDSVERGPSGSLDSVNFDVTKAARADLIAQLVGGVPVPAHEAHMPVVDPGFNHLGDRADQILGQLPVRAHLHQR